MCDSTWAYENNCMHCSVIQHCMNLWVSFSHRILTIPVSFSHRILTNYKQTSNRNINCSNSSKTIVMLLCQLCYLTVTHKNITCEVYCTSTKIQNQNMIKKKENIWRKKEQKETNRNSPPPQKKKKKKKMESMLVSVWLTTICDRQKEQILKSDFLVTKWISAQGYSGSCSDGPPS